jgi:hypothetical protein
LRSASKDFGTSAGSLPNLVVKTLYPSLVFLEDLHTQKKIEQGGQKKEEEYLSKWGYLYEGPKINKIVNYLLI